MSTEVGQKTAKLCPHGYWMPLCHPYSDDSSTGTKIKMNYIQVN